MGEIPVPIPNTEVKPHIGDGTAGEALWESSTMPPFFLAALVARLRRFFLFAIAKRCLIE